MSTLLIQLLKFCYLSGHTSQKLVFAAFKPGARNTQEVPSVLYVVLYVVIATFNHF